MVFNNTLSINQSHALPGDIVLRKKLGSNVVIHEHLFDNLITCTNIQTIFGAQCCQVIEKPCSFTVYLWRLWIRRNRARHKMAIKKHAAMCVIWRWALISYHLHYTYFVYTSLSEKYLFSAASYLYKFPYNTKSNWRVLECRLNWMHLYRHNKIHWYSCHYRGKFNFPRHPLQHHPPHSWSPPHLWSPPHPCLVQRLLQLLHRSQPP